MGNEIRGGGMLWKALRSGNQFQASPFTKLQIMDGSVMERLGT